MTRIGGRRLLGESINSHSSLLSDFFDAVQKMTAPAERLDVPNDADTITYTNADLTETFHVFEQHGLRFLTPEEIHATVPEYPTPARLSKQS
jgi:hypothetical protein